MRKSAILLAFAPLALVACVDDEGPAERVGEEIDEAFEDIQTRGGEDPLNELDDAADEVQDAADDALDQAEDALE